MSASDNDQKSEVDTIETKKPEVIASETSNLNKEVIKSDENKLNNNDSQNVNSNKSETSLNNEVTSVPASSSSAETIEFVLVYQNQRLQIKFELDKTISQLKEHVQTLTSIPPNMQKIMFKGLAKDEITLRALNIKNNDKLMLIGSKPQDVEQVMQKPTTASASTKTSAISKKEPLCSETAHKKVIEKYGKPDDAMPGIINIKESLPSVPLYGMFNKNGHKVRLTFKLETDELWLSTKERTEKIPMSSIKSVISEPITGHEEYHLMGIQIGATEQSRYWVYWVPAQYIDAIREALFG